MAADLQNITLKYLKYQLDILHESINDLCLRRYSKKEAEGLLAKLYNYNSYDELCKQAKRGPYL